MRPSGCSSYDPPQGGDGLSASPLSGNVWYNHWRNVSGFSDGDGIGGSSAMAEATAAATSSGAGFDSDGRAVRQCVGFPPPYRFDRAGDALSALVVEDGLTGAFEDTGVGTTVRLACPIDCLGATTAGSGAVRGSPEFYTDDSAVCMAAVHAGVLTADTPASPRPPAASSSSSWGPSPTGQALDHVVVVARLLAGNTSDAAVPGTRAEGSTVNSVSTSDAPGGWARGFALEAALPGELTAQTVAGRPAGPLEEGCGALSDGQPPQEAVFGRPWGIDAWRWTNITDRVR